MLRHMTLQYNIDEILSKSNYYTHTVYSHNIKYAVLTNTNRWTLKIHQQWKEDFKSDIFSFKIPCPQTIITRVQTETIFTHKQLRESHSSSTTS